MISTDDTNYFCESKFWTFISTESWKLTPLKYSTGNK